MLALLFYGTPVLRFCGDEMDNYFFLLIFRAIYLSSFEFKSSSVKYDQTVCLLIDPFVQPP